MDARKGPARRRTSLQKAFFSELIGYKAGKVQNGSKCGARLGVRELLPGGKLTPAVELTKGNSRAEVVSGAGKHRVLVLQAVLVHACDGRTRETSALQPVSLQ